MAATLQRVATTAAIVPLLPRNLDAEVLLLQRPMSASLLLEEQPKTAGATGEGEVPKPPSEPKLCLDQWLTGGEEEERPKRTPVLFKTLSLTRMTMEKCIRKEVCFFKIKMIKNIYF